MCYVLLSFDLSRAGNWFQILEEYILENLLLIQENRGLDHNFIDLDSDSSQIFGNYRSKPQIEAHPGMCSFFQGVR